MLIGDEIPQITSAALNKLDVDIVQCQALGSQVPVKGCETGLFCQAFDEVNQLLNLVANNDYDYYMRQYDEEQSNYSKVPIDRVIILLDKLRNADKKGFFNFSKDKQGGSRDYKMIIDKLQKFKLSVANGAS